MSGLASWQAALAGPGLRLQTGPLALCLHSRLPQVAAALALLYGDHPQPADGFADFHVAVDRVRGVRGWVKPQVGFSFDGEVPFKPLPLTQAFAMLEWGLNWCVATQCHQYLVLHAASLEKNGRALVMPAPPGSGKSTLCAALMLSGWRLLSDELTLIDLTSGLLHGLVRPVNLKNASIGIIARRFPQAVFGPAVPDTQKGLISHLKPTPASIERAAQPARAQWVIYPAFRPGARTHLASVGQASSFMKVVENAFNYTVLGRAGFEAAVGLIDATRSVSLEFSDLDQALTLIDAL